MKKITVIIEGGGVTEILDIPDDIMIEVRDYDAAELPLTTELKKQLITDRFGDKYMASLFTKKLKYIPSTNQC